jgi:hypothetical protein
MKDLKSFPILFHNGTNYDNHFIVSSIEAGMKLDVIAKSFEHYIQMETQNFKIIDSYKHLPFSLETLVNNLKPEDKKLFNEEFINIADEQRSRIAKKPIMFYNYIIKI